MDTTQLQQQPIQQQQQQTVDFNNLAEVEQQRILKDDKGSRKSKPYVKILEQPASKALRFRYECEGRSAGSIPGVNSTPENKTYPTIEIVGYKGRAVVVVSCVTKDPPHRPHPHNLVGKDGCRKGVCTMEINSNTMQAVFSNLGIQCVKKKDIEAALKAREDIRVDPYKTGFTHRFQPSSIDLNSVRLCFQVFMESEQKGRFTQPLTPVVTDPIFDKKAMSDLVICRLSSCTSSVLGNTQIILLCEKVAKEDIAVRFYEEKQGHVVWEGYGDFQHTDVHKQAAITFKTPRYHTLDVTDPVKVFIQLKRPSDGVTSDPLPFEYKPLDSDEGHLKRKRKKTNEDARDVVVDQHKIQHHQIKHSDAHIVESVAAWNERDVLSIKRVKENVVCWNPTQIPAIKTEPTDSTPQSFVLHNLTPSPQSLSPHNYPNHRIVSPYNIRNVGSCTSTGQPLQTAIGGQSSANYNPPMPGYSLTPESTYFMGNHFEGCLMNQGIRNLSSGALGGTHSNWCLNQQTPPPAHPSSLPQNQYNTIKPDAGENCDNIENLSSQQEHGLTNLLNIDSNLLIHIDSKDQDMLKLNTEELQLSNLSISS